VRREIEARADAVGFPALKRAAGILSDAYRANQPVPISGGERIAVFRDGTQIGALTNLCAHQHGPIGEGRVVDGCVTCPWHGYQYRLADGCAPPPFTEKLATYRVRIRDGVVEVDPNALPPGTPNKLCLLRCSVSAAHSFDDIDTIICLFGKVVASRAAA
jgi:nitrite reductase/ring-hydroxylating ferredoxin subunit